MVPGELPHPPTPGADRLPATLSKIALCLSLDTKYETRGFPSV